MIDILQMTFDKHFIEWKYLILIKISIELCSEESN